MLLSGWRRVELQNNVVCLLKRHKWRKVLFVFALVLGAPQTHAHKQTGDTQAHIDLQRWTNSLLFFMHF